MTAIDPNTRAAHEPADGPQHAEAAPVVDTYLDYAIRNYAALAKTPPPMPMDVHIAALIGVGDETRVNTVAVDRLTIALDRFTTALEKLIADPTAVLRAGIAADQQQAAKFGYDEAEAAQRAAEETGAPRAAAGG